MSRQEKATSENATLQSIMTALEASYGNLAQPDSQKVYITMESPSHRQVVEELRAKGIDVSETTDLNDDVATHLNACQNGDEVGLALSGVGQFAALRHQGSTSRPDWIMQSEKAPTALATLVAKIVEGAGFTLLGRDTVMQTVAMNRTDGTTEATLYQVLFTDSDVIP